MFLIVFRIKPLHHRVRTTLRKRDLLNTSIRSSLLSKNTNEDAHHWLRVQRKPFDFLQGFFGNVRRRKGDKCLTTHTKVVVRDDIKYLTVRLEETAQRCLEDWERGGQRVQ